MILNEQDFMQLRHLLPASFAGVVAIVGIEKAFMLVKHYGGTVFRIGQNQRKGGKVLHFALAEQVGDENATRIETALLGQRELYIPKCEAVLREFRNRQIRRDFDTLTNQQPLPMLGYLAAKNLARQYDLSERMIYEIVNAADCTPESVQMSLF
ncbi:Mor transcription activator family protein [Kingella negevensis]|uniref:Mor transcription activator family protein n=1 Tax=Kingella negevensis TaxID=1522312 RepID=UPI00254375D4|nr:Mor transcription activator family protein [Kingella negevensis]WII93167.1 Mor transcription activator family protein [Kingella negevensis]